MPVNQGLRKNARSPGSIDNAEHNDSSGSKKVSAGAPASVSSIIATSTAKTPVGDFAVLRVSNTTASWQYVYVGPENSCPAGAPAITDSLAIAPNTSVVLHGGESGDPAQAVVCKTSSALVQVAILNA